MTKIVFEFWGGHLAAVCGNVEWRAWRAACNYRAVLDWTLLESNPKKKSLEEWGSKM